MSMYLSVTPSDTVNLPAQVKQIWCATAGTIVVQGTLDSVAVSLGSVPAGEWITLPCTVLAIKATGTTAGGIVAIPANTPTFA